VQSEGNVPIADQARHLRELRDAHGPVPGKTLLDAMIRSQDRIVAAHEPMISDVRLPDARRAWAAEAVRWASTDCALIRTHERVLLAALR
jgi:hypothetical protein